MYPGRLVHKEKSQCTIFQFDGSHIERVTKNDSPFTARAPVQSSAKFSPLYATNFMEGHYVGCLFHWKRALLDIGSQTIVGEIVCYSDQGNHVRKIEVGLKVYDYNSKCKWLELYLPFA